MKTVETSATAAPKAPKPATKPIAPAQSEDSQAPAITEGAALAALAEKYGIPAGSIPAALRIAATVHRSTSIVGRLPLEMRDSKLYRDGKRVSFDRDAVSIEHLVSYDAHRPLIEAWRTLEAGPRPVDKVRAAIDRERKANK